jgi:hypothetical protein
VRGATTLAIGLAASAALPATAGAAGHTGTMYRVVAASGIERVTFAADRSNCAARLTCNDQGTVTYKFGGTPRGRLVSSRDRRGHVSGAADFRSHGITVSRVSEGATCTDTVRHADEHFTIESHSRLGKLLFRLHGGDTDHLATDCPGPTEADLRHDHALPQGSFKPTDLDGVSTSIRLKGKSVFRERGYSGTASWQLKYTLQRFSCSPACKIP